MGHGAELCHWALMLSLWSLQLLEVSGLVWVELPGMVLCLWLQGLDLQRSLPADASHYGFVPLSTEVMKALERRFPVLYWL